MVRGAPLWADEVIGSRELPVLEGFLYGVIIAYVVRIATLNARRDGVSIVSPLTGCPSKR